ncbi:hypothetical protein K449DRAFT_428570 [Hypoxylon sp. EC38]|nr:hypothetical protein K449DRAFT_428570 [Hypoxylon sp. EC38]
MLTRGDPSPIRTYRFLGHIEGYATRSSDIRNHLDILEAQWGSGDIDKNHKRTQYSGAKDRNHAGYDQILPDTSMVYDQLNKPPDLFEPQSSEFLPLYKQPQILVYEGIREGLSTKIAFENLRMLFNFNETLYCPAKRGRQEIEIFEIGVEGPKKYPTKTRLTPQAYRVVYATGGVQVYNNQEPDNDSIMTSTPERNQEGITIEPKATFFSADGILFLCKV